MRFDFLIFQTGVVVVIIVYNDDNNDIYYLRSLIDIQSKLQRQTDPFISHIAFGLLAPHAYTYTHNNITAISHQSSHNNNIYNIYLDAGCGRYMI